MPKVVAAHVVKRLNEDEGGPWFDRIVMPGSASYSLAEQDADPELEHRRVARATSFITALKPIERYVEEMMPGRQTIEEKVTHLFAAVDGFWRAVRELNPICFHEANSYVLLKTPGIFAEPTPVIGDERYASRASRMDCTGIPIHVGTVPEVADASYWYVGSDPTDRGDGAKYGSMKGFAELGDLLYDSLKG